MPPSIASTAPSPPSRASHPRGEEVTAGPMGGEHLLLLMRGGVQAQNSALALLTLRTLGLYEGIFFAFCANTIPGRFQMHKADLYVDGFTLHSLSALLCSFATL